jgi:hypothetical protein
MATYGQDLPQPPSAALARTARPHSTGMIEDPPCAVFSSPAGFTDLPPLPYHTPLPYTDRHPVPHTCKCLPPSAVCGTPDRLPGLSAISVVSILMAPIQVSNSSKTSPTIHTIPMNHRVSNGRQALNRCLNPSLSENPGTLITTNNGRSGAEHVFNHHVDVRDTQERF